MEQTIKSTQCINVKGDIANRTVDYQRVMRRYFDVKSVFYNKLKIIYNFSYRDIKKHTHQAVCEGKGEFCYKTPYIL